MRSIWFALIVSTVLAMVVSSIAPAQTPTPTPIPKPFVIEGTIIQIVPSPANAAAGKVTIAPAPTSDATTKPPITFIVNLTTKIYKDGKEVKLSGLAVTDACRAMVYKNSEGSLVATIVYARTVPPPVKWARGKIVAKELWNSTRTFKVEIPPLGTGPSILMWFSVGEKTKIVVDGLPATYDKLAIGQSAEVSYNLPPPSMLPVELPILALTVSAKNPPPPPIRLIGRLQSIDLDKGIIMVLPRTATSAVAVPVAVNGDTKVNKFGEAKLANLTVGDSVDIVAKTIPSSVTGLLAINITVMPETFMGVVAGVILNPNEPVGTLLVFERIATGTTVTPIPFKIVPKTKIVRNGVIVPLEKLLKGDYANLKYFRFGDLRVAALVEAKSVTPIAAPLTRN